MLNFLLRVLYSGTKELMKPEVRKDLVEGTKDLVSNVTDTEKRKALVKGTKDLVNNIADPKKRSALVKETKEAVKGLKKDMQKAAAEAVAKREADAKPKTAVIDEASCTGCGLCVLKCPKVFAMKGNKAVVISTFMSEDRGRAWAAVAACPVSCIRL